MESYNRVRCTAKQVTYYFAVQPVAIVDFDRAFTQKVNYPTRNC